MSAETELAGAVVLWPEILGDVRPLVEADDFEEDAPRKMFKACCQEEDARRAWSFASLGEILAPNDLEKRKAWVRTVIDYSESVVSSAHAAHHARLVRAAAVKRRLTVALQAALADLWETPATEDAVEAFVGQLSADLAALGEKGSVAASDRDAGDVLLDAVARQRERETQEGLSTGLSDLDRVLHGLRPGKLYVIAGRPSLGKSAFGQQLVVNVAKDGHHATLVELEMPEDEIGDRSLCMFGELDGGMVSAKQVCDADLAALEAQARELRAHGRLRYVTENYITFAKVRAILRRHKRKHGLELAVIDYAQQIRVQGFKAGERQLEVTEVFRSLKQISKELAIPIVALAQLNREAEGQRPTLAHLRESGAIENEADVVILLHGERDGQAITAIVAKNRGGRTCDVALAFLRAQFRIELPTTWKGEAIYDGRS